MRLLTAGLLGLMLGAALPANAQSVGYSTNIYGPYDPYTWNVYTEGPGIKFAGDGMVFHPGAAIELGYDTNPLLAPDQQAQGAAMLRLRAHLDLATLPPQRLDSQSHPKVEFRFGAMFEYRQYLSPDLDWARQFNGVSDLYLAIRPRDPLSLRIYNNLIFTNDARNQETVLGRFAPRLFERFGLLGVFRPGNGPLELGLTEAVQLDYYLDQDLSRSRSIGNDASIYAQLRVLPQTTLRLQVRSSYVNYYDGAAGLPSAVPLRITLGLNTLLVPAIGVTVYAGYGNSLQIGTDGVMLANNYGINFNNFIGGAELRLRIHSKLRLALGWARDFFDSIYATYYKDDRLYLHYDHYIWRGLSAQIHFDTYFRQYGALVQPNFLNYAGYQGSANCIEGKGANQRCDTILNLTAELNYRALSWMLLGVSYSLLYDLTDFQFQQQMGATLPAQFNKHIVLGRIDIAY